MATEFRLNPRVKWRWEGKDKILLNTMIGMNRTAGEILELCEKTHTLNDITEEMSKKYPETPKEKIYSDIEKLLNMLLKLNVLISKYEEAKPLLVPAGFSPTWHITSFFNNRLFAPVRVVCMLTLRCDADCMHCYAIKSLRDKAELPTEEWKQIIDELHKLNVFMINFSGGEPLLREDLEELIDYANKKGIQTRIQTNAFTLSEERIRSLLSAGLTSIEISLDGANPKTHDTFRRLEGSFQHTVDAISILVNKNALLQVDSVITTMNLNEIPQIISLLYQFGVRRIFLMRLISAGRALDNRSLYPTPEEYIRLLRQVYELDQKIPDMFIFYPNLPASYYERSIGLGNYEKLKNQEIIEQCIVGGMSCTIGPSGDIMPCDICVGSISLGNVRRDSFGDVWNNSDVFDHLRRLSKGDQIPCRDCSFCGVCTAGCRALPSQIGTDGNRYAADPLCFECFKTFGGK